MNIYRKLIVFFIFLQVFILSMLNVKNPEETKFYLFTSKTEDISLGNLITISFISGFSFSSLLSLISKNNSQESVEKNFTNNEEIDKSDENNFSQELNTNRPPERDLRESQPTISVNYRFVDQDNNSYSSKKTTKSINHPNNEDNDWVSYDNEW